MATTFTRETKPATTFTRETKPTTTFQRETGTDFLLKEDGFYLLLENGGKIIIRREYVNTQYSKEQKP